MQDGALSWAKEWSFSSRQVGGYGPEGNTEGSLIAALNGSKLLFAHPTTYSLQVGGGRDNLTVSESNGERFALPYMYCLYSCMSICFSLAWAATVLHAACA